MSLLTQAEGAGHAGQQQEDLDTVYHHLDNCLCCRVFTDPDGYDLHVLVQHTDEYLHLPVCGWHVEKQRRQNSQPVVQPILETSRQNAVTLELHSSLSSLQIFMICSSK